jgi:hypothetical protein
MLWGPAAPPAHQSDACHSGRLHHQDGAFENARCFGDTYPNLAYKSDVGFAPVGIVVDQAVLIVAKKSLPPNDLREFATYLKANVGKTEDGQFRRRLNHTLHLPFAQLDPQRATRRTLHRSEKHMLAGVGLYRSAA